MSKKILFIHHGTAHGGAPLSLLYTALGAKEAGYTVMVALAVPSNELRRLYNSEGIGTIDCPWLCIFHYSTGAPMPLTDLRSWLFYLKNFRKWKSSQEKLVELVKLEGIDIVHLNSMALINSAIVLLKMEFPFVWHVREPCINYKSVRGSFVSKYLLKSKAVIFISQEDQQSWLGDGVRHGTVIHNFIDFESFTNKKIKTIAVEERAKFNNNAFMVLYVGGLNEIKGVVPLLSALHQLKMKGIPFYCLMPGSRVKRSPNLLKRFLKKFIFRDFSDKIDKLISSLELTDHLIREPFDPEIRVKFAMADVVVFPSIRKHFARPVVEAAAAAKPVIASNFPGMKELVDQDKSGFLVEPDNSGQIADKLSLLYGNKRMGEEMGEHAFQWGKERFDRRSQIQKILRVYENLV